MDIVSDVVADIATDGHVLVLHGAFDVRSTWEVRNAIYEVIDVLDDDVVIDMTDVSTIDMTALRLLAVATRHAWLAGHHLTVRNPGPAVRRMVHLARLAHAIEVERVAATA
ncbi:STAS domain-containing protein [Nocardioides sp. zg-1230]|uniref:STAS domain-containing protein n=1 Tax=Nocardioides sp. zg-1230 TaxID=2736601 RepID=UPI001554DE4E|nr:STAS domain-containing protein [Nocardioides sp. zg-1230]NPC43061.1 STAS domain-containing protein [Nocardioides sp. zg-1230]